MPVTYEDDGVPLDRCAEISGKFIPGAGKERHAQYLEIMITRFSDSLRQTFEANYDKELPLNLTLGFRFERDRPSPHRLR